MNKLVFSAMLLILTSVPAWSLPVESLCKLENTPEIIVSEKNELHQVWTLEDQDAYRSEELPNAESFHGFRQEILSKVKWINADHLLRQQYLDFVFSSASSYNKEANNPQLALTKKAGKIRPIQCLEAQLLAIQIERQSMIENPSEFMAFFLVKTENNSSKLKIYYSTTDTMGLRGLNPLVEKSIEADLASGWILSSHIHNHPFDFKNPVNILGSPSPSLSDVQAYRATKDKWGLRSARVTNGFDTIEISQEEFMVFKAHGDEL